MLRRGDLDGYDPSGEPGGDLDRDADLEAPDGGGSRIRCPRCGWLPRAESLWSCTCLHAWNTFDTGGRCPAGGRQWLETACLRCHRWSKHRDWYVDEE